MNAKKARKPKRKGRAYTQYKDTIFTLLFSDPEVLVALSNAILGTNYPPGTKIEIRTLKNALVKGRYNDLAFLLDGRLIILIEHQSTVNDNMPYRMLQYIAETYKKLHKRKDEYREKMFTLQRPKFIVLYNGVKEMPEDVRILRLSDMFAEYAPEDRAANDGLVDLELTVKVYNINNGRNKNMVKCCETLREYCIFIDRVHEYGQTMPLEEAIRKAMEDCINQNVLKEFLEKHRGELVNMLISEYDWDLALEVRKEEGWEEGMERGMEKGRQEGMANERRKNARAMKAKGLDTDTIAEVTGLTVDDILRL